MDGKDIPTIDPLSYSRGYRDAVETLSRYQSSSSGDFIYYFLVGVFLFTIFRIVSTVKD